MPSPWRGPGPHSRGTCDRDGLETRVDIEAMQQVLNVGPDGVRGQEHSLCDRGPAQPVDKSLQNLPLTRGQHVERTRFTGSQMPENVREQPRWDSGFLLLATAHRRDEVMHRPVFGNPASYPVPKGFRQPLDVVFQVGEVDHVRPRAGCTKAPSHVDAVLGAELSVDHGDVDPVA